MAFYMHPYQWKWLIMHSRENAMMLLYFNLNSAKFHIWFVLLCPRVQYVHTSGHRAWRVEYMSAFIPAGNVFT